MKIAKLRSGLDTRPTLQD